VCIAGNRIEDVYRMEVWKFLENFPLKRPRGREDNINMPPTKSDCEAVDN
jgi:hypothetical protein